jgi:hypothetical protein
MILWSDFGEFFYIIESNLDYLKGRKKEKEGQKKDKRWREEKKAGRRETTKKQDK